jgi:glyoxylase-like metal-dependent hydrolase (beta-lactamase superfamily II)
LIKDLRFEYGVLERVSPNVRRILARNPSPFTYFGTGTYVVGHGRVAVIDPGPALSEHVEALLRGLGDEQVSHVLITHTHLDHSPAARELVTRTGAAIYGFGPHHGHEHATGESVEEGADLAFVPDVRVKDGDVIAGDGFSFECVHTPGHASNHMCFALREESALFCGDHVMGWSTSVVAPPDGNMGDYLRSLDRLIGRDDARYYPTHGAPIDAPRDFVKALRKHRNQREQQILDCLAQGTTRILDMVPLMYVGVPTLLYPAASLSVYAHVLHLIERDAITTDEPLTLTASFRLRS